MRFGVVILAITLTVVALAGCGGGGGSAASAPVIDDQLFVPNYVSALGGNLFHWNHLPITVSFNVPTSWQGTQWADITYYTTAATAWNQDGRQPMVATVAYGSPADVVVQFVTRADFANKPAQTMGDTQITYDSSKRITSAAVRVTREYPSGGICSIGFLQLTIAHELGHAIGIMEHSPYKEDLMYASHAEGTSYRPTVLDLNTAMTAYPSYFTTTTMTPFDTERQAPTGPLRTLTID